MGKGPPGRESSPSKASEQCWACLWGLWRPSSILTLICGCLRAQWISQVTLVVKNLPANAGDLRDMGSVPGSGRSPGGENGNLLQYSCLGNPMDRGAWWATVHGIAKSWTRLKQLSTHTEPIGNVFHILPGSREIWSETSVCCGWCEPSGLVGLWLVVQTPGPSTLATQFKREGPEAKDLKFSKSSRPLLSEPFQEECPCH